jgi:hypothetical protein
MPAIALTIAVLIMAIALPIVLYQPLRKYAGRYPSYILAAIISMCLISGSIYLWKSANNAPDIAYAIGFYLPLQLVVLFWGLIWLRVNAFKFAEPQGPVTRIPVVSLPSDRIEPVLAASTSTGPWAVPATTSRVHPSDGPLTQKRPADATYDHSPADEISRNFFIRYWRGQFSLPFSFWIVGVLGPSVILIAIWLIMVRTASTLDRLVDYNPYGFLAFILASWILSLVWTVWDLVGLWRSATRAMHRRWRQGKHTFWGSLVKLIVINGTIGTIWAVTVEAIPQIYESYNIAFNGDPDVPDYALRISNDGTEIEITGGFKYGLSKDFEQLLKAAPQVEAVHLDSAGGRIGEAINVHDLIVERQLGTYVANQCYSACTIAFAGGKERRLGPAGELGFHAPAFRGMTPDDLRGAAAKQKTILVGDGFDPDFVTRALTTPAESLWIPTRQELIAARAITAQADSRATFTLATASKAVTAYFPAVAALGDRDPEAARAIVQQFYQIYLDGVTIDEAAGNIRQRVDQEVDKYLVLGDDETMVLMAKLLADQYRHLVSVNIVTCYKYVSGERIDISRLLTPELTRRELELKARIVRTAAERPPAKKEVIAESWQEVLAGVESSPQGKFMYLFNVPPSPGSYANYCWLYATLYDQIAQLPPKRGAALVRKILSRKK